jgi:hypothetical protein
MTFRGQFKNGVVVFAEPPELPEGAAVEVAPITRDIKEHDIVQVQSDVQIEGQNLRAGMRGAVVSVYRDGEAFAVEFTDLANGPDVVILLRGQIEKVWAANE